LNLLYHVCCIPDPGHIISQICRASSGCNEARLILVGEPVLLRGSWTQKQDEARSVSGITEGGSSHWFLQANLLYAFHQRFHLGLI